MALSVTLVTPEKEVLNRTADAVVVPGVLGELGILKGHAPLLSQLQAGSIRLRENDRTDFFAISGGFVEVKNNQVAIFAETAEQAQEIDLERARQAAERAKATLHDRRTDTNLAEAEAALRRAIARLRVAENLRRTHR